MFSIKQIFRESITVLLIATVISLFAGLFLRTIENSLLVILPLIILLPALNNMIGDFGIVITSRITTALYQRKVKGIWYHSTITKHLFREVIPISIFYALYISILSTLIANVKGFVFNGLILWKIIGITFAVTITLILLIFIVAVVGSIYVYKKNTDPDDILIPITTSIADLGSMIVFSLLVIKLF